MNITTKTGDNKTTFLINRRAKDDVRVEVLGCIDELLAYFILIRLEVPCLSDTLDIIIQQLEELMTYLAIENHTFPEAHTIYLETQNEANKYFYESLTHFVRPTTLASAKINLLRTKVRTLERRFITLSLIEDVDSSVLIYLNRLSDYLFIQQLLRNEAL